MPRICFLTLGFPPLRGGQEIHAQGLSEALVAHGLPVWVVTRRLDRSLPRSDHTGVVPVVRLAPAGRSKGKGWRAIGPLGLFLCNLLWTLLRDAERYDAVLISGLNFMPLVAVLAALITRKPCIVRLESPLELAEPVSSQSLAAMGSSQRSRAVTLLRYVRRLGMRRVQRFVAISREIERGLGGDGVPGERIAFIPNGIDTARFAPVSRERKHALRRALGLPLERDLLIYSGRLCATKGLLLLLEVWRELAPRHPDAQLVLLGSGKGSADSVEAELAAYVSAHGLDKCVALRGEVAEVAEYLQACDAFVFPSEHEGFGLALAEALACGLPALATRVGAAPELIEDRVSGILVQPKNAAELRCGLLWLLERRAQWSELGARARPRVVQRCGLDRIAGEYARLFEEVCWKGR